jgi:hypothetical protein
MKKIYMFLFALFAIFVLSACDGAAPSESTQNNEDSIADQNAEAENIDVDRASSTEGKVSVDLDGDLTVDATIEVKDDLTTATLEWDSPTGVSATEYCVAGQRFTYNVEGGSSDSIIIGLENFKGQEYCKASSTTVQETPMGSITTESVYYFDNTYNDIWVIATTSGGPLPAAQVTEMRVVNGQPQ